MVEEKSVAVIGVGDYVDGEIVKRRAREGYIVHAGRRGAEKLAPLFAEVEAVDGAIVARGP
ncbi:hypothetical protein Sj15T_25020 [Sphingobium sp. TA15]|uniref:SDR-family protein n=1 Tax=Sphingobium indicum (strain DSM 16413 / CCM 7287 / MTCC 6362 / UT26 / NBRC 101211 / UT26S) TaxID=452662 RepID=D4Z673_SPHIU|nr:SDR-family protein [Sphingobium indicum]BAI98105.1 SDR-family protein [Sphingobium indicum UT26S]BDD67481.1 hypothetical protein Sj15T_25020 [Sphingobium sp. TA15]